MSQNNVNKEMETMMATTEDLMVKSELRKRHNVKQMSMTEKSMDLIQILNQTRD